MGGPMCGHLVAAGFEVTAFDLNPEALARLRDAGARAAGSVAECAQGAEALITMLPAPPQVEQVLLGPGGAIAVLEPGSVAIDMSTSSTAVGGRVVAAASERGIDVLDAPVAGQSIGAQAGTLAIYVGGSEAVFERARPLLEAMGDPDRIFHLGPSGAGYTVKLLLNLLWFIQSVAVGEALTVGVRAGVPLERLHASARRLAGQLGFPPARRADGARRRRLRRRVPDAARHQGPRIGGGVGARHRRAGRAHRARRADPPPCPRALRRRRRRDRRRLDCARTSPASACDWGERRASRSLAAGDRRSGCRPWTSDTFTVRTLPASLPVEVGVAKL